MPSYQLLPSVKLRQSPPNRVIVITDKIALGPMYLEPQMPRGHKLLFHQGHSHEIGCTPVTGQEFSPADLDCPGRQFPLPPSTLLQPVAFSVSPHPDTAPFRSSLHDFLFQLRMTRNWSAPVCLPSSEESGSMPRSPIGFQDRRQVGGIAVQAPEGQR